MSKTQYFVGIDVSKDHLDVTIIPGNRYFRETNDETGIGKLINHLKSVAPDLIVLEATGGFEHLALVALSAVEFKVCRINPRNARDFAKATGQLAKTDKVDSAILARFAQTLLPQPTTLNDRELENLKELVSRRHDLVQMITAEKSRRGTARTERVREDIKAHIEWLEQRLDNTNSDLQKMIDENPAFHEKDLLLRTVPGVGPVLSATLLGCLPELGTVSGRKIAKLAGLAPLNQDSGKRTGKRKIWGGRAIIRQILNMAVRSACMWNSKISPFYKRLIDMGKPEKVARTAAMRKLLIFLNAMAKSGKPWQPGGC